MVDISQPWVADTPVSPRFPMYTRANVGEVAGAVVSPLFWSLVGGLPAEKLWRKALAEFGAFDEDEFNPDYTEIQGVFHGYQYHNLSIQRVFGVRMPGASPELMDLNFLGDASAPAYTPHPDDDKPLYTERILKTVTRVLSEEHRDDVTDDIETAARIRADRPDFSTMSDDELLARARDVLHGPFAGVICKHLRMVYENSIVSGSLDQALAALDDPSIGTRLIAGLGNIASVAPSQAMWELSRVVENSVVLSAAFDQGVKDLDARLRSSAAPEVENFVKQLDDFQFEFGSRSTNEWEPAPMTWETHPQVPLGMIERMRHQPAERNPSLQSARLRGEREEAMSALRESLATKPDVLAALEAALRTNFVYLPAREQSKTNTIRVLHEARLPLRELGLRLTKAGIFSAPEDIIMIGDSELDQLVRTPADFGPVVEHRLAWAAELAELEPPFIINGEVPPVETWARRKDPTVVKAVSGDVLTGLGACTGKATGIARIIENPEDAPDLETGEILVAPLTDPGWTPLFTSAEAVVVNVGATLSHAAIVSRELGIPCVLAVTGATQKIPNGAMITVDGDAGTVTIH